MRKKIIAVIGGHDCDEKVEEIGYKLGEKLSEVVDLIVCGGLGGVMEAVCKGFKVGRGLTVGILPGYDKDEANAYVDIVLPTGLGLARNVLVVKSADVVIALPGKAGTLSEVAYCLQFGIPVISLKSWDIPGVIKEEGVDEAVVLARKILSLGKAGGSK